MAMQTVRADVLGRLRREIIANSRLQAFDQQVLANEINNHLVCRVDASRPYLNMYVLIEAIIGLACTRANREALMMLANMPAEVGDQEFVDLATATKIIEVFDAAAVIRIPNIVGNAANGASAGWHAPYSRVTREILYPPGHYDPLRGTDETVTLYLTPMHKRSPPNITLMSASGKLMRANAAAMRRSFGYFRSRIPAPTLASRTGTRIIITQQMPNDEPIRTNFSTRELAVMIEASRNGPVYMKHYHVIPILRAFIAAKSADHIAAVAAIPRLPAADDGFATDSRVRPTPKSTAKIYAELIGYLGALPQKTDKYCGQIREWAREIVEHMTYVALLYFAPPTWPQNARERGRLWPDFYAALESNIAAEFDKIAQKTTPYQAFVAKYGRLSDLGRIARASRTQSGTRKRRRDDQSDDEI